MKKDSMRIIAVVMGEPDSTLRNDEVSGMLDYAFAQYSLKNVLSTNVKVKDINLFKSKQDKVSLVPVEDVNLLYKKINVIPNPTYKIKVYTIDAKISKGDIVGEISLYDNNKLITKVHLTVNEDIKALNIFELFIKYLGEIITGK